MDPLLAVVIIVALVCITVVTVALTKPLTKRSGGAFPGGGPGDRTGLESQAPQVRPPAPALQNISFKTALESDALASGLDELAKRQVEYALGLNSANAVVQAVSLAGEHDKLVIAYELSRSDTMRGETGEVMIPLREESGKFLPMLKEAKGGNLTRFARGESLAAANPANFAALIAGVAHILPGVEVLHGLKEIDRRLSALAQGRAIDQLAEIETIYNRLSEIFSRTDWMDRRSDLIATRDQLFKLRAVWRRELEQLLELAPDTPDTQAAEGLAKLGAAFFPPAFFIGKGLEMHRESEEEKLFGHLAATADLMQRIRLAMLLDISVSQALGEAETLAGVAMRNELEMWDGILEKFQSKRKGIRTFQTPGDLQTVEDALQGYVSMLSSVAMVKNANRGDGQARHEDSSGSNSTSRTQILGDGADNTPASARQLYGVPSDGKSPQEHRLLESNVASLQKTLSSGGRGGEEQANRS